MDITIVKPDVSDSAENDFRVTRKIMMKNQYNAPILSGSIGIAILSATLVAERKDTIGWYLLLLIALTLISLAVLWSIGIFQSIRAFNKQAQDWCSRYKLSPYPITIKLNDERFSYQSQTLSFDLVWSELSGYKTYDQYVLFAMSPELPVTFLLDRNMLTEQEKTELNRLLESKVKMLK